MSYLVLARKYRPQTFEEVVGQDHVTRTLQNAIRADRVAHALLLSGPRGVGKTSVARIMAKAMNCKGGPRPSPCNSCQSCREITKGVAIDVFEIDAASNRGIDEIRELRENTKYMPSQSRYKVYIIDEVHMLSGPAFNALLKTLEEPPSHVLFSLATTEAHKIPITILSRCQRHNFKRIAIENIVKRLKHICHKFSFNISNESLHLLAREAGGSMRDALSFLDHVMAYSEGHVSDDEVLDSLGAIDRKVIFGLSTALLSGDVTVTLNLVDEIYSQGHDVKRLYTQLLEHFRHLVVVKMGEARPPLVDAPENEITLMKQQVEALSLESLNQIFAMLFEGGSDIRLSGQPKLALEALFIKLAQAKRLVSIDQIIAKLNGVTRRPDDRHGPHKQEQVVETPNQQAAGLPEKAESLGQTWQKLLSIFEKECRSLVPNLEKAELTKLGKDFLEITVRGNSFYAARLRDQKSMAAIQKVCSRFFKQSMRIKILESGQQVCQDSHTSESDKTKHLKKEALSHPVVTDALEVFQGRVVDVKIL